MENINNNNYFCLPEKNKFTIKTYIKLNTEHLLIQVFIWIIINNKYNNYGNRIGKSGKNA